MGRRTVRRYSGAEATTVHVAGGGGDFDLVMETVSEPRRAAAVLRSRNCWWIPTKQALGGMCGMISCRSGGFRRGAS